MSQYLRLAIVALALTLPLLAFQLSSSRSRHPKLVPDSPLPTTLGEWNAVRETALEGEIEEMLAPDSYTMRLYAAKGMAPVWIYAAFYPGVGTVGAHDPLVCYPAQGWMISEHHQVEVDLGAAQSLHAWFLRTELAGAEEFVLYWFQPVDRWPAPPLRESALRVLDRFEGHPQYAFVRLSVRRPAGRREVTGADLEALESMARAVAPWVRKALDPGPVGEAIPGAPPAAHRSQALETSSP